MTLSLMPSVSVHGCGVEFFFPAQARRNVVISVDVARTRARDEGEKLAQTRVAAGRGANERVYVSPVTDRVNVGKDEGLRFRGWTEGDEAIGEG